MQYTIKMFGCTNDNFQWKNFDIFLIFAQNIDCRYTLEPPRRGGSNEYPQYVYPCKLQFFFIKVGFKGVFIARTYFPDGSLQLHGQVFVMTCIE